MSWLPRLQQRLSITRNEALTLLSLSLFLLVGTAGRYMCRRMSPVSADYYAELDSLFDARSAAALDAAAGGKSDATTSERISDEGGGGASPAKGGLAASQVSADSFSAAERETYASRARPPSGTLQPDPPDGKAATAGGSAHSVIDINQATAEELDRLPRVGPKIAERIIEFRSKYGGFQSVDELTSVRGIGPTTLELIRPHVRVGAPSGLNDADPVGGAEPEFPDSAR